MYHFAYLALFSTKRGIEHSALCEQNIFSSVYHTTTI